jgi:hypothetical protein
MSDRYLTMDAEAPIPFIRKEVARLHKPEETKFSYDKQEKSTKSVTTTDNQGVVTETKEETTATRTKKVILKCFGNTAEEDCESFFIAFERLRTEMDEDWKEISKAKTNDAQRLFDATDKMLTDTANAEWHDVIEGQGRDWEAFKTHMATYITTKVLPDDAYDLEVTYLQERMKPMKLEAKQWYLRMQTLNRYLPYFIPTISKLKEIHDSNATFKDFWKAGMLSDANIKKVIKNKAPVTWLRQLKLNTIGPNQLTRLTSADIVGYYETLENLEQRKRAPTTQGPHGRGRGGRGRLSQHQRPAGQGYQQRPAGQGYQQQQQQNFRGNERFQNRSSGQTNIGSQTQRFRGSGRTQQYRGNDYQQRAQNRFPSTGGQQQMKAEQAYYNEEEEKDTLPHEEEQYAAWSDHFDNDHITPGDDEEQDIHSTEDEVENEDEHFMFNESFDFQYG